MLGGVEDAGVPLLLAAAVVGVPVGGGII